MSHNRKPEHLRKTPPMINDGKKSSTTVFVGVVFVKDFLRFKIFLRRSDAPRDVDLFEGVEARQDASAGYASKDIGASALHHRHEAFVLHNLNGAVDGALVFDGRSGRHHHTTTDGVDGVGHESRRDCDGVAQAERKKQPGVGSQQDRLQGIVEAEVHPAVYENTDARNDESSVQTLDSVGLEGLGVDVDETLVLTLAAFALGVVGQTRTGVVERVDERERERTRDTAGQNIGTEFFDVAGVLLNVEHRLHLILKGEVESLRWEVTQAVGQVTAPQGIDSLVLDGSGRTVDDAFVWLIQAALTDHLILILDEQLDTLDGCGRGLRHDGGDAGEGEVLSEP